MLLTYFGIRAIMNRTIKPTYMERVRHKKKSHIFKKIIKIDETYTENNKTTTHLDSDGNLSQVGLYDNGFPLKEIPLTHPDLTPVITNNYLKIDKGIASVYLYVGAPTTIDVECW